MDTSIANIPLANLAIAFIPVALSIALLIRWSLNAGGAVYSIVRMLLQLVAVGYLLVFIFETDRFYITLSIIAIMILASSWIALRTIQHMRTKLFWHTVLASLLGGGFVLFISIGPVLNLTPILTPQYAIPLAGMVFANSMNAMSLALERLDSELKNNKDFKQARNIAFHASLIPVINTMFAVGIVSLPGMMTGQILSGVSPLIAVRYQILVMCMIFSASALSTALLLVLSKKSFSQIRNSV